MKSNTEVRIALLTEEKYIDPSNTDWYMDQVLLEDNLLIEALEKSGAQVTKVGWTQTGVDFSTFDAAVFSSIWDYYRYPTDFSKWIDRVEGQTTFFNSIAQIRDNMDKRYLIRYQDMGRNVVPTKYVPAGSSWSDTLWAEDLDSDHLVIKPVIGGAAVDTFQWKVSDANQDLSPMQEVLAEKAMIVQPFVPSIQAFGEVSHIIFDGKYSHSILKRPRAGDYRVQDDHGGRVDDYIATPAEIDLALSWLEPLNEEPVYARVDLVKGIDGAWWLGELELIEPELWLRRNPLAAEAFAQSVLRRL